MENVIHSDNYSFTPPREQLELIYLMSLNKQCEIFRATCLTSRATKDRQCRIKLCIKTSSFETRDSINGHFCLRLMLTGFFFVCSMEQTVLQILLFMCFP